jgi:hypothetical protein
MFFLSVGTSSEYSELSELSEYSESAKKETTERLALSGLKTIYLNQSSIRPSS